MGWREWLGLKVTPAKFAELMIGRARGLGLGEFEYDADMKELRQSDAESKWQLYLGRVYEEYVLTPSKDRANVIDNLRSMAHPNRWTQLDANTWSGHWDDAYKSSRMVTPEVIHQLGVPDPIVMVPTPDTLLVASGRSENALASLAYWCEQSGKPGKRALSSAAYRLNDRSWSAIPLAEQNTSELRNFQLRGISSSHEKQKQLLDDLHSRTDQDIWVAIYQLMKKEDSSLITVYTMGRPTLVSTLVVLSLLAAPQAWASEVANGQFRPSRSCEAYLSFAKGTNPDQVKIMPGADYEIREVNTREARRLHIQIPNFKEPLRWLTTICLMSRSISTVLHARG